MCTQIYNFVDQKSCILLIVQQYCTVLDHFRAFIYKLKILIAPNEITLKNPFAISFLR